MADTKKLETPDGVPDLSAAEVKAAQKEGVKENVKQYTRARLAADTGTDGDIEETAKRDQMRVPADLNTTFIAPLLNLGLDEFKDRVAEKAKEPLDENTVKGLLALERNGKNRTDYVQALMKRLGVKTPYDVANGGPGYTNDVTSVSAL
ncbi:hypothetical protein [Sphingomonas sp.]|uniref:hypothetical protein n=1 Tax=Sphingomonas sp. TaxID=28214 RepID=UPI0031CE5118